MAAREMGRLSLIHALSLVVLTRVDLPKFEPAAVRWLARLALEGREEAQRNPARRSRTRPPARPSTRAGREDTAQTPLTTPRPTRARDKRKPAQLHGLRDRQSGSPGAVASSWPALASSPAPTCGRSTRSTPRLEPDPVDRPVPEDEESATARWTPAPVFSTLLADLPTPCPAARNLTATGVTVAPPTASSRIKGASRWSAWPPPLFSGLRWGSSPGRRSAGRRTCAALDRALFRSERARRSSVSRTSCSGGTHTQRCSSQSRTGSTGSTNDGGALWSSWRRRVTNSQRPSTKPR